MNTLRTMDDEFVYPSDLLPGTLSLPNLFPILFHLLSLTSILIHHTTPINIPTQWQRAWGASAYLNLFCFILPATTALTAQQRLYVTADEREASFLHAAVTDTTTRSRLRDGEEMLRHWREARAAFEAKQVDVQRNQEKVDALSRVGELLVDIAGLLGKAVVIEAQSKETWVVDVNLRHDLGQAREKLEALRTEIVEVAGRLEVICGKMREQSDAAAASSRRAMEQRTRERERETQRKVDEILRRCKEGEELGVGPSQRPVKREEQ